MITKIIFGTLVFLVLGESLVKAEYATKYPDGYTTPIKCVKGQPKTRYFKWTMELYHAMGPACRMCAQGNSSDCFRPQCITGDGFQKGVMSINRMIPGPAVHVCEGDTVIIDLINMAHGTSTTIHWHGLHMVATPYMDGVPHVTQCPIEFESTFRYKFYATQPGTHFWHSHAGHHKLNGIYGALIVRQPDEDNENIDEYDYDHPDNYVYISDWRHTYGETSFPGLPMGASSPDSLLINGRGTFIDPVTFKPSRLVPLSIFYVRKGKRSLFRFIGGLTLVCLVKIQFEKLSMVVLETDSFKTEPFETDSCYINAGERLGATITPMEIGDYILRVTAIGTGGQPLETYGIVRCIQSYLDYKKPQPTNFPDFNTPYPMGDSLNDPQATCFYNDKKYCVTDLTALKKDTDLATRKPDYKFVFSFYNNVFSVDDAFIPGKYRRFANPGGNIITEGVFNNISIIYPSKPILTQYYEIDQSIFCNKSLCPEKCEGQSTRRCCPIYKIKTGSTVEMILHDFASVNNINHPIHLHGHAFMVMAISNDPNYLKTAIANTGKYTKSQPVFKDTVTVPRNGVVVVRFRANNPGVWLVHCHYELHLAAGMGFIFQVGEPNEWVKAPKDFPKCGDYTPGGKMYEDEEDKYGYY